MTSVSTEPPPPAPPVLAKPIIEKRRRLFLLIWLVPLMAAGLAVYYVRDRRAEQGPEIVIQFKDATGVKEIDTHVSHLGVQIGKVIGLQLTENRRQVLVRVRLKKDQDLFACKGALFWVVRPEISPTMLNGLETVLSGPYIEAIPGDGEATQDFVGLNGAPIALGKGLRIILHTPRIEHLEAGAPIYYRGIQVGLIEEAQLSHEASDVDIRAFIWDRYSPLVRTNSEFWILKSVDVKGGLFSGVRVKVDSLRSLLSGGLTFATPEKPGAPVHDGYNFGLYDEPKKDWLEWSPKIDVPPENSD